MERCDGAELLRPAWRGLFSNNRTSGCLLFLLYSNKLKSVKKKQKENSIVDYFPSAAWSRVIHYVLFVLSWCSSPRNVPPSFQIVCLNCVLKSTLRPFFPARQIWSMSNWRYWNVRTPDCSSNVSTRLRQDGYGTSLRSRTRLLACLGDSVPSGIQTAGGQKVPLARKKKQKTTHPRTCHDAGVFVNCSCAFKTRNPAKPLINPSDPAVGKSPCGFRDTPGHGRCLSLRSENSLSIKLEMSDCLGKPVGCRSGWILEKNCQTLGFDRSLNDVGLLWFTS